MRANILQKFSLVKRIFQGKFFLIERRVFRRNGLWTLFFLHSFKLDKKPVFHVLWKHRTMLHKSDKLYFVQFVETVKTKQRHFVFLCSVYAANRRPDYGAALRTNSFFGIWHRQRTADKNNRFIFTHLFFTLSASIAARGSVLVSIQGQTFFSAPPAPSSAVGLVFHLT